MTKTKIAFWSGASVLALVLMAQAGSKDVRTFHGEVADSQCALNVHSLTRSHEEMLKSKSMGGTASACALYCIKYLGGEFVLSTKKNVYRLQNPELVKDFAGTKVKLTGTLDEKSNTIHIVKVEAD